MKKITITVIALIAIISTIAVITKKYSSSSKTADSSFGGTLSAQESSFDFGTISMARGKVSHMFKVKNASDKPASIEKMYTSCMCTVTSLIRNDKKFGPFGMPGHTSIPKINQILNPGEEAEVEVIFDPAAHGPAGVGKIQRAITLENGSGRNLQFNFSAFITP